MQSKGLSRVFSNARVQNEPVTKRQRQIKLYQSASEREHRMVVARAGMGEDGEL